MKSYGHLDCVSQNLIGGWAIIENSDIIPEIIIYADNREICRISASVFRKDLLEKKYILQDIAVLILEILTTKILIKLL